jgi:hypothetical protein
VVRGRRLGDGDQQTACGDGEHGGIAERVPRWPARKSHEGEIGLESQFVVPYGPTCGQERVGNV